MEGLEQTSSNRHPYPLHLCSDTSPRKKTPTTPKLAHTHAYLEVSHHDQAQSISEARDQGAGVDPAAVTVLDDLGIPQQAHHDHWMEQT